MIFDRLDIDLPPFDGVTRIAICAELPAVEVGVAIRTPGADLGKNQAGVALTTTDIHVHAMERISGLVVVEFGNSPERRPRGVCMAVLTCEI